MNSPKALARFTAAYFHSNVQGALEYRTSLISQGLGMFLTNFMWITFWGGYFEKFHLPGWGQREVITLWAVVCASFGVGNTLCGNAVRLAGMITRGELDFYLALPKPILPHALISRMHLVAPGDLLFGIVAYGLFVKPSAGGWALFALCTLTGAVILVSFSVLVSSLAFWLGNAESIFSQAYGAMANFSTYPSPIFEGVSRVLIFTLIPAGFMAGIPVELLGAPTLLQGLELVGAALGFAALAFGIFHWGVRRYSSGNLLLMRG